MTAKAKNDYVTQLLQDEEAGLVYIMDPMCSWCWAFRPVLAEIRAAFPSLGYYTLAGGLAPDSDQLMPEAQKEKIAAIWKQIELTVGTQFNHAFWQECQPRRSTYPACRALLLARTEGKEDAMIEAIQEAYYLKAKNPSDIDTLSECALSIGMEPESFERAMTGDTVNEALKVELDFVRQLGVGNFPTLVLKSAGKWFEIALDYRDASNLIRQIQQRLSV